MTKRYRPEADEFDEPVEDRGRAVARLLNALGELDRARARLNETFENLTSEVNRPATPKYVYENWLKFWRAGGCTREGYKAWLTGRRPTEKVKARKGLRLVANNKTRSHTRYRQRDPEPPRVA